MPNSIEELAQTRQRWIDASKENHFEEGIKRLLTELYPDNAHFIYELLQNAEDTHASKVRFTLSNEKIVFEHNRRRLFDYNDVESITNIGANNKRDDLTNIGKFGVGFKAVFAYTNTPEIHSGDFHFRIRDLVVPVVSGVRKIRLDERITRFIFPFDHSAKQPRQAVEEIKRGFEALNDNTLLFLKHIHLIEYFLPDGTLGYLKRISHRNGRIDITHASHHKGRKTVSNWLRYHKDVVVVDDFGDPQKCRIAIAYSLQKGDWKKNNAEWEIVPLDRGQVSIYFPAEKETSGLKFHIHAPFASTVARDSVRDCEANCQLRNCIAELVVDSLTDIRDSGMLTMDFLAVLPNQIDNLLPFYEPIREAIVCAFKERELTPTRSGKHAPADRLYRGPAKIAEALNDEDLSLLTNFEPPLWAANPPQQNQREDRFLDSLEIDTFGWNELIEKISPPHSFLYNDQQKQENRAHQQLIEELIEEKKDAWLMRFYALMGEACEVVNKFYPDNHAKYLTHLRIVRVESEQSNEHVLPKKAFFSPEQGIIPPQDVYFVKPTVYSTGRSESQKEYATKFLEYIGVRLFNTRSIIELRLADYDNMNNCNRKSHCRDIIEFIKYWKETADVKIFMDHCFLRGESISGDQDWCMPKELCMDLPFESTGLKELMSVHQKYAMWSGYKEKLNKSKFTEFTEFLRNIGVMYRLEVSQSCILYNKLFNDLEIRDSRRTKNCIYDDYSIENLESYLQIQSISVSKLIWEALIRAGKQMSKAQYRPNMKYQIREFDSQLVCLLKDYSWIPDKSGAFHKAYDMTKDDLHADFRYDDHNGLLTAIGFGERAKKLSEEYVSKNHEAKKMGFESADEAQEMAKLAQVIREQGLSPDRVLEQFRPTSEQKQPSFPLRPVPNPERRKERLGEQLTDAPDKEYEKRERSVRTTNGAIDPITWLRNQYTNEAGQMVCQICKEEMPFRKRDGNYYFEKKEVLSKRYLPKEHEAQYLALCPVCAAKYDEFVKTDDEAMAKLREKITSSEDCGVPILFGNEQTSIRFVETHYHDLKAIIAACKRHR